MPPYHDIAADAGVILYSGIICAEERYDIIAVSRHGSGCLCSVYFIAGYDNTVTDQVVDGIQVLGSSRVNVLTESR